MTFDKDLQIALIRNQQVDSQLREMQNMKTSSQFKHDLEDIDIESNKKSSDVQEDAEAIENGSCNQSSELQKELQESEIQSTRNDSQVQDDFKHTEIQSNRNDFEVQDNLHDMDIINRKIREYTAKLKFWMDKKKQCKGRQAVIGNDNELKSIQVTVTESMSTGGEEDPMTGFHMKSSRNFNEYYNTIKETKQQIMHGLGDIESHKETESEEDVPKEVYMKTSPKSPKSRINHNEQSIVLKNRHYLTQVAKKSHSQVSNEKS